MKSACEQIKQLHTQGKDVTAAAANHSIDVICQKSKLKNSSSPQSTDKKHNTCYCCGTFHKYGEGQAVGKRCN